MTDTAGLITGVRFYKASANTGPHVANLWTSDGTLLATAPFTDETNSGWQQATFSAAVPVAANTGYVASYHTTTGHTADDRWFSTMPAYEYQPTAFDKTPLHTEFTPGLNGGSGVFTTGPGGFPDTPSLDDNYWVDVTFTP